MNPEETRDLLRLSSYSFLPSSFLPLLVPACGQAGKSRVGEAVVGGQEVNPGVEGLGGPTRSVVLSSCRLLEDLRTPRLRRDQLAQSAVYFDLAAAEGRDGVSGSPW